MKSTLSSGSDFFTVKTSCSSKFIHSYQPTGYNIIHLRLKSMKYFFDLSFCLSVFFRYEIRDIHLVEESVLESLKVKADFHNFKPRPFNMLEFYDRTGHDINDMLLACHFHGTECRAEDFKVVSCLPRRFHPIMIKG